MGTREWLLQRFRALCDRVDGGVDAVAAATDLSADNLRNLYSSEAIKLQKSGNARGLGATILRKLDEAYPGWFVDSPPPAASPSLMQALHVLGEALDTDDLDEVRDEIADNLSQLAKRSGAERYQKLVLDLIEGRYRKQAAGG